MRREKSDRRTRGEKSVYQLVTKIIINSVWVEKNKTTTTAAQQSVGDQLSELTASVRSTRSVHLWRRLNNASSDIMPHTHMHTHTF